jgi:hypothetical protein
MNTIAQNDVVDNKSSFFCIKCIDLKSNKDVLKKRTKENSSSYIFSSLVYLWSAAKTLKLSLQKMSCFHA